MEISAIIMIIVEIVLTLVLVYEIIRKNRFATIDSSNTMGKKIEVLFLMVIVIALGVAIVVFFRAQSTYWSEYDSAYYRSLDNGQGNLSNIYESRLHGIQEASRSTGAYQSNMDSALATCVILSIMGGIDLVFLFATNQKLKNEMSAIQNAEQSPQQHMQRTDINQQRAQARFCPNCGAEIQPDCSFCVHCGKKL